MGSGFRQSEGVLPAHIKEMDELREFSEEVDDEDEEDEYPDDLSGSRQQVVTYNVKISED